MKGLFITGASHEQLDGLIEKYALTAHAGAIRSLARPCVRVTRERVEQAELKPTDSRLGGEPHLPRHWPWPWWDTHPLAHLATIRLSEASRHDATGLLPREGMLYFWYDLFDQPLGFDPKHAGQFRVDYWPDESAELVLRELPIERVGGTVDQENFQHTPRRPCKLGFERGLTIPNWEWIEEHVPGCGGMTDWEQHIELQAEVCGEEPGHQLLGHADAIQRPMEEECQLVTHRITCEHDGKSHRVRRVLEGVGDWQLLMQIDSDEEGPGWQWGFDGKLYYWVRKQDLAVRDFSRIWGILQCG